MKSFLIKNGLIFLLVASFFAISMAIKINFFQFIFGLALFFSFSLWGHFLIFPIYYKNKEILDGLVWGSVFGIAISALVTSAIVYFYKWNLPVLILCNCFLPLILILFQFFHSRFSLNEGDGSTHDNINNYMVGSLIVVSIFICFPYLNVGKLVEDNFVYAWLFGHDFINRLVHVESLSRGIPLEGMFFSGEKLNYYWLSYIFPALLRNFPWLNFDLQQSLLVSQFYYTILAVSALNLFLKKFIHSKIVFLLALFLCFVGYSYAWLIKILSKLLLSVSDLLPFAFSHYLQNFSGFSHSFYRFFLVEPQAILGLSIILMILNFYKYEIKRYESIVVGILLGLLFGVEATNGIMLMLWFVCINFYFALFYGIKCYRFLKNQILSIFFASAVYIIFFMIDMYSFSTGKSALLLSPNWFSFTAGIVYFPVAYGPPFIFGLIGIFEACKKRDLISMDLIHYIVLFFIGLFFVFFIQNPTEYHFGLLKATRIIPISLLIFSVYFIQNNLNNHKIYKYVVLLLCLSAPGMVFDNIIASDVSEPSTYVRAIDKSAAEWIQHNTPKTSIIQAEPNYPGLDDNGVESKYSYSFIPIFAHRKTVVGEWKVSSQEHGNPKQVKTRFVDIDLMFSSPNPYESHGIAKTYGINYIYISNLEKKLHKFGIDKFNDSKLFKLVYQYKDVKIYEVL